MNVTLDGRRSVVLDGKEVLADVYMRGTWKAIGTVTLPAVTLGGDISLALNKLKTTHNQIYEHIVSAVGQDIIFQGLDNTRPFSVVHFIPYDTSSNDRAELSLLGVGLAALEAGNWERSYLEQTGTAVILCSEAHGTGTLRPLQLGMADTTTLVFTPSVTVNIDGTVTLGSSLTLGGAVTVGGNTLSGIDTEESRLGDYNYIVKARRQAAYTGNAYYLITYNAANAEINRLAITGGVDTAVATWAAITHTNIQLTGAANAFGGVVLATGGGATVDNVITALQNLGLVTQS